ncbi:hypothetical protein AGMMS49975_24750 [Clostridia bacterium]|nr:hypothetical protein AGMMS49975_24750 [Clostridia bacterium]
MSKLHKTEEEILNTRYGKMLDYLEAYAQEIGASELPQPSSEIFGLRGLKIGEEEEL